MANNDQMVRWLIGQIMKDFDFFDEDDIELALQALRMHDPEGKYAKDWGFSGKWDSETE